MTERRVVALIGLPRTGKSTYLGALWQIIQDDRETSIAEVDVRGDRSYLQLLGEKVAQLEEIARTDVGSEEGLRVVLGLESLGEVDLNVPDLSGETLRLLVEERTWHRLIREAVESADGILVFVHPDLLRIPIRTNFTTATLAAFLEVTGDGGAQEDSASPNVAMSPDSGELLPEFEPRLACTAATLIDAIENAVDARTGGTPLRVAIVVSAWDEVDGAPTPLEWVEDRLPAVWSMCCANGDLLTATVFGVSAQGGRIPEDRDALLEKGGVLDRAYARNSSGHPVPLSRPIEWALGR